MAAKSRYQIIENPTGIDDDTKVYEPRGAAKELWGCKDPEIMIAGPAETGKTFSALMKLNAFMWKYPGAQGAIGRKTLTSVYATVLQTYEKKILGVTDRANWDNPVHPYGGERPQWYDYPNGARLWIFGLDNPGKALSSERDIVYINQAEETELHDWETLMTRTTGRSGNSPYAQLMGDCNPDAPFHWIINRPSLKVLHSKHEDNPTLYDRNGNILPQGVKTMAVLNALSGVRLQRLRFGKWVAAEGQIYETFDIDYHIIDRWQVPDIVENWWLVDFGWTNPFVWINLGFDRDGRMYVLQYIYFTERIVEEHCKQILKVTIGQPKPSLILTDHDAEGQKTMEKHLNMKVTSADKTISVNEGIDALKARLEPQLHDRKPRFSIVRDALVEEDHKLIDAKQPHKMEQEFGVYVWDMDSNPPKPVKKYDHAMDPLRYGVVFRDLQGKKKNNHRNNSFSFG